MRIIPRHFFINNFRNFRDASFDLGERITIISGQNGVGKSNILSLIASGSGVGTKSMLGSNFQPEFTDFFNIDTSETYDDYKLFLSYEDEKGEFAFAKRLSFKNDTKFNRGIRIIPRTTNMGLDNCTIKKAANYVKNKYGVGADARVRIPTIYLSLSRLYPLGEQKAAVKITKINKNNTFYRAKADEKYKKWYNAVIPNSIVSDATLTVVEKDACSRASLHMDMLNTPTLSQSIGQDNLGNIISALVDVYLLSLQDDYSGALLCIDEIDVSLHPDTQIRLLNLFDKLSEELRIQFVVSTHSLSVLKECIYKEKKNSNYYKVVYIKNSMAPYISNIHSFEVLEADMMGSLQFDKPRVGVYFEDSVGMELFGILFKAFKHICSEVKEDIDIPYLRNSTYVDSYICINDKIRVLKKMQNFDTNIRQISTELGCEELIKVCQADSYFKRIIFILDGDARYKEPSQKPKISDYLEEKYDQKEFKLNDRNHPQNMCFFPDYFAPESFLYRIIHKVVSDPITNYEFWKSMDRKESTALYTTDKIKNLFVSLPTNYNNDNLKNIFKEVSLSEIWKFIQKSDIVSYYYSDYTTVQELLSFVESLKKAFDMTWPITLANRYL